MALGNGSVNIPSQEEHGVFDSTKFSSDQVTGNARISGGSKKYRKKKQKGGNPLDFEVFTPDAQNGDIAASGANQAMDAALNDLGAPSGGLPTSAAAVPAVPNTEGGGGEMVPSVTNPSISMGGRRSRRKKSDKKKKTKKRKQSRKKRRSGRK